MERADEMLITQYNTSTICMVEVSDADFFASDIFNTQSFEYFDEINTDPAAHHSSSEQLWRTPRNQTHVECYLRADLSFENLN